MSESVLPSWQRVLVVVAHPDDESFGLGAVLSTFVERGAEVHVLCFTRGEASTLHGVIGDLAIIREGELRAAADELGIADVRLGSHPDGGLSELPVDLLLADALEAADGFRPNGIVAFDSSGVTGHPDHQCATEIAIELAKRLRIGILGWTIPADVARHLSAEFGAPFVGHAWGEIDLVVPVDRTRQRRAVVCHPSQAVPGSALWTRLDDTGDVEYLRWLSADR